MKKVTSIRIEDDFLEFVEEVRKAYKQVLGFDLKRSDILEGCLMHGMRYYTTSLRNIVHSTAKSTDGMEMHFNEETINTIYDLEDSYLSYLADKVL